MKKIYIWLLALLSMGAHATMDTPALAIYYGNNPPWDALQAFDLVVVDPGHVPNPAAVPLAHTRLAAYVAVGEVQPGRPYAENIPKNWLRGENKNWGSRLIDQAVGEWPAFFADRIIEPLWQSGYRSFFLDTLDSYQRFAKTAEDRARQEDGLIAAIRTVKQRHPQAKLIFNRGFEILDRTSKLVDMVAAESLFQGWDAGKNSYTTVTEADRSWLLGQLHHARDVLGLPVIAIDYVAPGQRELARSTAKRISALGFTPWVATPDLATMGVGSIEVMPRKVLVVYGAPTDEFSQRSLEPVRLVSMPLNYLGYIPQFLDTESLPATSLVGKYAGVVVWISTKTSAEEIGRLSAWLKVQIEQKVPVVLINPPGELLETGMARSAGLSVTQALASTLPIEIVQQDALIGFERQPKPGFDGLYGLSVKDGHPLLTLRQGEQLQVAAAITPWGGYVLAPYSVSTLPDYSERWVIAPFQFLQQALQLPDMPIADTTTESGRRMFMVHMDGDGFVSRSELPGNPLAGEVVRDRIVNHYQMPMTMSVIEAELSPQGLYPGLSDLAERTARDIFRAPNVSIASHSYSHPFVWHKANANDPNEGYNLRIPGYRFDLRREVEGSVHYIQERLAPPGKKVELFFWTGDCVPGSDALTMTGNMGLLNFNGGDTVATQSLPTLTEVDSLGLSRAGGYQVFAPNQNENVYTNNWQGPFYGYERVIETFEFTEKPRRLKPIDIYFHTYLATKRAGIQSLEKAFSYALTQETTPVRISDYIRKVLNFQTLAIARTAEGWRVRGATELHTLRVPTAMGLPDMQASAGVAGYRSQTADSYIHLVGDSAELVLAAQAGKPGPRAVLVSANAAVVSYQRTAGTGGRWELHGQVPLKFTFSNVQSCRIRVAGRDISPVRLDGDLSHYELQANDARPLEAICRN